MNPYLSPSRTGPGPRSRNLHPLPHSPHRAGHPDRRHRQHHLHPVPRGAPQVLGGTAEDRGRGRIPHDHPRSVSHVPLCGLREKVGHQMRGQQLSAGRHGVHTYLQRRLHRCHQHRSADG